MNSKEWKKWLFWFSFSVASIAVYKTIDSVGTIFTAIGNFLGVMMPFLMAILLAYILYIPCKKIEKKLKDIKLGIFNKHARGLSILLVYLILLLFIFISINFIIPSLSTSIKDLASNLPNYYSSGISYLKEIEKESIFKDILIDNVISKLNEINIGQEVTKWISLENISEYVKRIIGATSIIFDIFVTIIVSIYMLLERTEIKNFLSNLSKAVFDKKTNEVIARYYEKTNGIFFSYIAGQILDAFVVGIITSIAMLILHIRYAALLGFMIGLFNIIPYFGAIVAVVIAIIITIFTGGFAQALWLTVIIVMLQQIDANIINPKILGNSLNLSPILVIFSVTIGGTYFGVLGMFLGVPVCAFLKLLLLDFIEVRNKLKE